MVEKASFHWVELICADLKFKFLDSIGHSNNFLLLSQLLSGKTGHLLLESLGFSLLVSIVSLNLLSDSVEFVGESLSSIL